VIWEIVNKVVKGKYELPYSEYPLLKVDYQIFFHVAKKGYRPTIPVSTPVPVVELIKRCWDENPQNRPTTSEILSALIAIENDYQHQPEKWDSVVAPMPTTTQSQGLGGSK